ncbi:hypothetical protein [Aquisphaera insulae]|uniref:hypothetical protein n=1 Tax=Aquisphaera insulae TaxID=2712864 RepID=UPI0013EB8E0A|nr:hypothetical protein [Aquisphaera insulae]
MTVLAEDPTYLAVGLVLAAAACFVAVRVTQQGKFLMWAMGALGVAGLLVLVDYLWVTDNERIERVVYDLRGAVLASDADRVLANLTPDVEYVQNEMAISGEATRELIRANLRNATFDFVHLRDLQASAGRRTRRGKAEFRVYARGTLKTSLGGSYNVGTVNTTWSLGFQETAPGVWQVNRITPVVVPDGAIQTPMPAIPDIGLRGRPGPGRVWSGPFRPPPEGAPDPARRPPHNRRPGGPRAGVSDANEGGEHHPSRPGESAGDPPKEKRSRREAVVD